MKITYDLPPEAERDLSLLAAKFGSMNQACISALCVGCGFLLQNEKVIEEIKKRRLYEITD
jgi:hypothetical protein